MWSKDWSNVDLLWKVLNPIAKKKKNAHSSYSNTDQKPPVPLTVTQNSDCIIYLWFPGDVWFTSTQIWERKKKSLNVSSLPFTEII